MGYSLTNSDFNSNFLINHSTFGVPKVEKFAEHLNGMLIFLLINHIVRPF